MNKIVKKTVRVPKKTIKAFNIRMSHELWVFMKQRSIDQEISVNEIINKELNKMKDRREGIRNNS